MIEAIRARASNAGRSAIDPHILFALWLYTTLDGVGSGREVVRLSQEHDAYRWICGGVSVNYHALNDFRAGNKVLMDELLTDNVAALAAAGAIRLARVAQGACVCAPTPVRPLFPARPAYTSTFKRPANWRKHSRHKPEVAAAKKRNGSKAEARASTTDADARVMKMGDGGFRPAFNVQLATEGHIERLASARHALVGAHLLRVFFMAVAGATLRRRAGRAQRFGLVEEQIPLLRSARFAARGKELAHGLVEPLPEQVTLGAHHAQLARQGVATAQSLRQRLLHGVEFFGGRRSIHGLL